ncbi:Phosphoesterase PHP [Minicystis rosea]|nr:Phosphoesterase PHP [Minicystis rosea]
MLACAVMGCEAPGSATQGAARPSKAREATATGPQAASSAGPEKPAPRPRGFLKGQLHAHTGNSGDSETDPREAAAWYAARGYDFVVFTDHNVVTDIPAPEGMLVLRGIELTQNLRRCEPAPEPKDACLLHVNGLFVAPSREHVRFPVEGSVRRLDLYGHAVDRAIASGGLAQLNHPNFHHGADAEILIALAARGLTLVEIANMAVDSDNEGDARHPSTEALWDAALARGARVFGTATDDAHHYGDAERVRARGEVAYTGDRGFVMVRAEKSAEAIRAAMAAGDFYASTGVLLERVELSRESFAIDAVGPGRFEVIADGRVVETMEGRALRHDPRKHGAAWARVRVTDASGRRAFTQPVWLR